MRLYKNLIIIVVLLFSAVSFGKIIYVDDDATGANDGSSWENAYIYLQDALADANSAVLGTPYGEKPVEIRVAQGIYKPDQGDGITLGHRDASFKLISGVALSGGYAGILEPEPNERDYERYETVLSGDLAGNDVDVNDPNDLFNEPTRAENSYHIITSREIYNIVTIDGLTITSGNANKDWTNDKGGGIRNILSDIKITKCKFIHNSAVTSGGGIYNNKGDLVLNDCEFYKNSSYGRGGGGLFNKIGASVLKNCIFRGNAAFGGYGLIGNLGRGGAIYDDAGYSELISCTISENIALQGGGIYSNEGAAPKMTGCVFSGNRATEAGGALANQLTSYPSLVNCTIIGNYAPMGGGIANLPPEYPLNPQLINCVIWENKSNIMNGNAQIYGGLPYIRYCCIEDFTGDLSYKGYFGTDPCFVQTGYWNLNDTPEDPNDDFWIEGDYHLKSQAGRFDTNTQSWLQDDVTSPCIDAGDPMLPIGLEPFPNGGIINMGAYGGTVEASKSYFGEPLCQTIIAGDINGDCKVDFADLEILVSHWLEDDKPVNSNLIVEDDIEYYIQTDKSSYNLGENIHMLYQLTNLEDEERRFIWSPPVIDIIVQSKEEEDFNEIWHWSWDKIYAMGPVVFTLEPGESREIKGIWPQIDLNGPIHIENHTQIQPGIYRISGVFFPEDKNISIDITIIP